MDEEARRKKVEYNVNRTIELRKKKIIKQFNCTIFYEEYEKINKLLNEKNMSKADFVRYAYEKLKKEV